MQPSQRRSACQGQRRACEHRRGCPELHGPSVRRTRGHHCDLRVARSALRRNLVGSLDPMTWVEPGSAPMGNESVIAQRSVTAPSPPRWIVRRPSTRIHQAHIVASARLDRALGPGSSSQRRAQSLARATRGSSRRALGGAPRTSRPDEARRARWPPDARTRAVVSQAAKDQALPSARW